MSLLDRLARAFLAMRTNRRTWRPGEDVLLGRSEGEDVDRLLDFEEADEMKIGPGYVQRLKATRAQRRREKLEIRREIRRGR